MCCGEPSFEFYKKSKLIAMIGFHHGKSIRWQGGEWPGDASMTTECATYFNDWLKKNGVDAPSKEAEEELRRKRAMSRRQKKYFALLPQAVFEALQKASNDDESKKAFEDNIKDKLERAELYLKLYGCHNGGWNYYDSIAMFIKSSLLSSIDKNDFKKAVKNLLKVTSGAVGAGRWLFSNDKWYDYDKAFLNEIIPDVARICLGHPRKMSRKRTISALGKIGGDKAIEVLRKMLNNEIATRELKKEEEDEPGGQVEYKPGDGEVDDECSEQAYSAFILAKLKDKESLELIKKLAKTTKGREKELYDKAIKLLEK